MDDDDAETSDDAWDDDESDGTDVTEGWVARDAGADAVGERGRDEETTVPERCDRDVASTSALTTRTRNGEGEGPREMTFGSVFTHAKAGMETVDRAKVRRVIYGAVAGTAHHQNELRKEAKTTKRIETMRARAKMMTAMEWESAGKRSDERVRELENARDTSRRWVVVDMDGFYAACEELANPELKKVPVAVAAGPSCVLTTANYVARKFGVRAAMPGFIAKKLCPELVFVKPDFTKYVKASKESRSVFAQYNPDYIAGSLDEAYIEVTEYCKEHDTTMEAIAAEIREKVKAATGGLTCSVGGACSRRLAKVCSDFNKPDGQYILEPSREAALTFLRDLPVRKMYGIGKTLERVLNEFDIETCGDLLYKRALMLALFTPKSFEHLIGIALGVGTERHPREEPDGIAPRKGVSKSETFAATSDKTFLDAKMTEMATMVALECQRLNLKGRMVAVKLKRSTFDVIQRQTTLAGPTNDVKTIVNSALRLMRNENSIGVDMTLRLVGARVSQFDHEEAVPEDQKRIDTYLATPTAAALAANEETWTCDECTRVFPLREKTEHLDWHVARRLQSRDDAEQCRARLASSHKGPTSKKARGKQQNLKAFFTM